MMGRPRTVRLDRYLMPLQLPLTGGKMWIIKNMVVIVYAPPLTKRVLFGSTCYSVFQPGPSCCHKTNQLDNVMALSVNFMIHMIFSMQEDLCYLCHWRTPQVGICSATFHNPHGKQTWPRWISNHPLLDAGYHATTPPSLTVVLRFCPWTCLCFACWACDAGQRQHGENLLKTFPEI